MKFFNSWQQSRILLVHLYNTELQKFRGFEPPFSILIFFSLCMKKWEILHCFKWQKRLKTFPKSNFIMQKLAKIAKKEFCFHWKLCNIKFRQIESKTRLTFKVHFYWKISWNALEIKSLIVFHDIEFTKFVLTILIWR